MRIMSLLIHYLHNLDSANKQTNVIFTESLFFLVTFKFANINYLHLKPIYYIPNTSGIPILNTLYES